jgi:uncharacterized membrane protein
MTSSTQKSLDVSSLALAGISVLYPIGAAIGVRTLGAGAVLAAIVLLLGARIMFPFARKMPFLLGVAPLPVAGGMIAVAMFNPNLAVRLYPVFMNLAMLLAFGSTLVKPPTMIEIMARVWEPDLPDSGVRYTRNVTIVWVMFFAVNGSIALWTSLYAGWQLWALYNGGIAYVAMGLLFAGELLVRRRVRARYTQ